MTSYTEEALFPLLDTGSGNWDAVMNAVLTSLDAGGEITVQAGESIGQYDAVYLKPTTYVITAVDIATDKFTIAGAHAAKFIANNKINVKGSTGNDAAWTIESATDVAGPSTEIIVEEDVTNATVDGVIHRTEMFKAKADVRATMPAVGIVPAAVSSGVSGKVRRFGWIDDNAAGWSFRAGQKIYLSDATAGDLVGIPPTRKQFMGVAKSPTKVLISVEEPDPVIVCNNGEVVTNKGSVIYN